MLCNKEFENEQTQSSAMVLKKKERKKERKKYDLLLERNAL